MPGIPVLLIQKIDLSFQLTKDALSCQSQRRFNILNAGFVFAQRRKQGACGRTVNTAAVSAHLTRAAGVAGWG